MTATEAVDPRPTPFEIFDHDAAPPESDPLRSVALALQRPGRTKNTAVADAVLAGLREHGKFYHIAGSPDFQSAMFFDSGTKVLERVRSDSFVQSVSDHFAINRAAPVWAYVKAAIENASIGSTSTPIETEAFWAARGNAIYLSNGPGRIVRVRADRFEEVDNGTDGVLFPRGATLAPWTFAEPRDPFEDCTLFRGLNATAGHGPLIAKLWTMSLPSHPRNKPPLCLAGGVGSGKTRFALGICELFGLPSDGRTIKVEESGERDFWPVLDAGGLAILDNADTRARWLPDALAAAATGCGETKRKLYTDGQLIALRPRAWIAITTSRPDTFAGDPGLADRLLVVRMARREGDTLDGELSAEIAASRNGGLTWLCGMLARALGDTTAPPATLNRRHPDFGRFAFRLGRALGLEREAAAALSAAESDKSLFCLESDTVGSAVLAFVTSRGRFTGSAGDLIGAMKESAHLPADSPLTPKGLGRRLESLWPHLTSVLGASREKNRNGVTQYTIGAQARQTLDASSY
jgi:hypothetical protein